MTGVLSAALALAVLAGALGGLLLLVGRWLAPVDDGRLESLLGLLPGTNCGACGQPGCRAFASALLAGAVAPAACRVSSPRARQRIAAFLKVEVGAVERRVARLACAGGRDVALRLAAYGGEPSCAAAAVTGGGGTACAWACLGHGDCQRACSFAAIRMNAQGLPVVDEARCTACGDCQRACPRGLFHIVPAAQSLWVACSNPLAGSQLLDACAVACTACGRCVQDAAGSLRLQDNLPQRVASDAEPPPASIERCPTGAIVCFEGGRVRRGACALQPHARLDRRTLA